MIALFAGSCGGVTFGWFDDQKMQAHHSGSPTYPDCEQSTGCKTSAMDPSKERKRTLIFHTITWNRIFLMWYAGIFH